MRYTRISTLLEPRHRGVVYLSGAMSVIGPPTWGFPAFHRAASWLRQRGFVVINPAELDGGVTGKSHAYYMKRDKVEIRKADAMILLPGWKRSTKGVPEEMAEAKRFAITIYEYDEFKRRFC